MLYYYYSNSDQFSGKKFITMSCHGVRQQFGCVFKQKEPEKLFKPSQSWYKFMFYQQPRHIVK